MARKVDTITKLANDLEKGILPPVSALRDNILNPSEMNYLTLRDSQIDSIMQILESDKNVLSPEKTTGLELDLASSSEYEDGFIINRNSTYRVLKGYIDLLNESRPSDDKYELGHASGVFTTFLKLLRENYKPDSGSEFKNQVIARQRRLIDNTLRASVLIDRLDETTINGINGLGSGASIDDLETVIKSGGSAMTLDIEVEKDLTTAIKNGKAEIVLGAELKSANRLTGNLTSVLSKSFRASFSKFSKDNQNIDNLLETLEAVNIRGSHSFKSAIVEKLESEFFDKKIPSRLTKSKVRISRKIAANNAANKSLKARIRRRTAKLKTLAVARKKKKKFIVPTVTLKALINDSLAEFIRIRMGDSNEPAIKLRNQTGRFSESAKLLTLNRSQAGALLGTYSFARDPYGTFLPGGRLHTQQRDPKLYIEGAIRDVATRVLKKQFTGIQLELK